MYAGGTKTAQSKINIAIIVSVNLVSSKPFQSRTTREVVFAGSRVLSKGRLARKHNRVMSAKHRIVQGNPI